MLGDDDDDDDDATRKTSLHCKQNMIKCNAQTYFLKDVCIYFVNKRMWITAPTVTVRSQSVIDKGGI